MEKLITELNSPVNQSSSERVQELQRRIQQLQRQKSGWQKGFDLLRSEDQNLRFYGALTLTIKINADWENDGLHEDENARRTLLEGLLNTYSRLVNSSDIQLVLLKLCSTLTAYFIKDDKWQMSMRQVSSSLLHGEYVALESIADTSSLERIFRSMKYNQLRGALWFASTLIEDVVRLDNGSPRNALLVERLASNSQDVWLTMNICLDACVITLRRPASNQAPINHLAEITDAAKLVLSMILPWLEHAPPDPFLVSCCVESIFACFETSVLQDHVIQTLTGIADSSRKSFSHTDLGAVSYITESEQAAAWIDEMKRGEFSPEAVRYVEFLIALIRSEDLSSPAYFEDMSKGDNLISLKDLITLKDLMRCEGIAVIEDEICQLVLECLTEVVEQYNDRAADRVSTDMKPFITEVCLAAIAKAEYPVAEVDTGTSWDVDDRARFQDFRNDVADFLTSAFVALGSPLIEALALRAISDNAERSWPAFEASLFCLLEFSDTMDHGLEQYDPITHAILSSSQWASATGTESCPIRARQTAIRFIAQKPGYLRRHGNFLVPCLDFLFRSLQVSGSMQAASRAIQTLCYSERKFLVGALPQFIDSLPGLEGLEPTIKHRVYTAVASIIQALPTENDKIEPLNSLMNHISLAVRQSLSEDTSGERAAVLVDLLQALTAIGKGLRAPSDHVVDLESSETVSEETAFWTSGAGHHSQTEALSLCTHCLNAPGVQPSGETVEAACEFLKSGYTEVDPSPFKFSAAVSVDFLTSQIRVYSPNIDAVMGCASAFLASADQTMETSLFARLIDPVFSSCQALTAQYRSSGSLPTSDFPASTIEFVTHLLQKWSSVLLSLPDMQSNLAAVFDIAIIIFTMPDTLPRRAAASFFTAVLDLTGHNISLTTLASNQLSIIMSTYTTPIIAITMRLIAGDCARSEIEAITEILRKVVSKQTSTTRTLLKDAMNEQAAVLSPKAYAATTLQQRLRFVAQAEALRGARKTIELAKDFWIASRGASFGYVT